MDNTRYAELGSSAIYGGAGSNVREDPDYERLENEIGKMSNPTTSASLDWKVVADLCTTLLSGKGKDMLVAAYLGAALMQLRGLPGLADGMQVLADMMNTFWDDLYPPLARVRARRNAMQWLIERVQSNASETDWSTLPPQDGALIARLLASCSAIDALTGEKDPEAPSMRALSQLLGQVALIEEPVVVAPTVAAPAPAPGDSVPGAAPAAGASPVPLAFAAGLDADADLSGATDQACALFSTIGDRLLQADMADPAAYRYARIAVWAAIDMLPPGVDGGTRIAPPISQVTDVFARLTGAESNEDIVRFAEAQLPAFPFWLDLQCACALALERLGPAYSAAHGEVCGETARLLGRLDGLAALRFDGGMPFANADTQQWLGTLGGAGGAGGGSGVAEPGGDINSAIASARVLAADGQLVEAAATLQRLLSQPLAPASKLLVRIRLAELLDQERPLAQLQAFAHSIVAEIDRHALDSWDAALALQGLQVAYRIAARDAEVPQLANALLQRIVALDARAAVSLLT